MPDLEKQFAELKEQFSTLKKDYELRLDSAKKEAESWKSTAQQKQDELKKFEADAEKATEEKNKAFAEIRITECKHFLEKLKKDGRISPALEVLAAKLMESMTSDVTVYTSETKDGKKISHSQLSLFKELLSSMAKTPVFRSMTVGGTTGVETPEDSMKGTKSAETFMKVRTGGEVKTYAVDDVDLDLMAREYIDEQAKLGRKVDYAEALVQAEKLMRQAA